MSAHWTHLKSLFASTVFQTPDILKQYACFLFAMPEGKLETLNLNDYISHLYNHFSKIIVQHLYDFSISIINKIVIIFLYIMTNDVYFTAYSFKSISII